MFDRNCPIQFTNLPLLISAQGHLSATNPELGASSRALRDTRQPMPSSDANKRREQQQQRRKQKNAVAEAGAETMAPAWWHCADGTSATVTFPHFAPSMCESDLIEMIGGMFSLSANAAIPGVDDAARPFPDVLRSEFEAFGKDQHMMWTDTATGEQRPWWFSSRVVRLAYEDAMIEAAASSCPMWRTTRRSSRFMIESDFMVPVPLRAYVVRFWEYHPSWGTTAPPPTQMDPSTWRGMGSYKAAQELWFLLRDEKNDEGDGQQLPAAGPVRTRLWKNALKRYERDATAHAARAGDNAARQRMDAEKERGRKRRQDEAQC